MTPRRGLKTAFTFVLLGAIVYITDSIVHRVMGRLSR